MQLQESLSKGDKSVREGNTTMEAGSRDQCGRNVRMLPYWFEDDGRGQKTRNAFGL